MASNCVEIADISKNIESISLDNDTKEESKNEVVSQSLIIDNNLYLKGHKDSINCIALHPYQDKQPLLATGSDVCYFIYLFIYLQDGTVRLWNLNTKKAVKCVVIKSEV